MRSRQGTGLDGVTGAFDGADRPVGSRLDETDASTALAAASAGRPDVLGAREAMSLQRSVGNAATAALFEDASDDDAGFQVPSGGSPLAAGVRDDMEDRFGTDFSGVRIHTGPSANESAGAVDAQAYTTGNDIVFADGFDPDSASGRHMLAHELTHVVQQRNGPVEGIDAGLGVAVSDPGDRHEQDAVANAERVMSEPAGVAAPTVAPAAPVQRLEDDSPSLQRSTGHEHEQDELRDADQ